MKSAEAVIGLISISCRGANTESPLSTPIIASVDISVGGERRVGCPFIEEIPYEDEKGHRRVSYRCTAGRMSLNEFMASLNLKRTATENFQILCDTFPKCIHKYPH